MNKKNYILKGAVILVVLSLLPIASAIKVDENFKKPFLKNSSEYVFEDNNLEWFNDDLLSNFYKQHEEEIIQLQYYILDYLKSIDFEKSFIHKNKIFFNIKMLFQDISNPKQVLKYPFLQNLLSKSTSTNLLFTPEKQEMFNTLLTDFEIMRQENQQNYQPINKGGITKVEWEVPYFWLLFPGVLAKLWLNNHDSIKLEIQWDTAWIVCVPILCAYLGQIPGLVWGIALDMVLYCLQLYGHDTNPFRLNNDGDGVFIQSWSCYYLGPWAGLDLFKFRPQ